MEVIKRHHDTIKILVVALNRIFANNSTNYSFKIKITDFTTDYVRSGLHYAKVYKKGVPVILSTPSQCLLAPPFVLSLWRSEVIKAGWLTSQHTEDRPLWCSLQRRQSTTSSDPQLCLYISFSLPQRILTGGLSRRWVEESVLTKESAYECLMTPV